MRHIRLSLFQQVLPAKINLVFTKSSLCENPRRVDSLKYPDDINRQDRSSVVTCCDGVIWLKLMIRSQS